MLDGDVSETRDGSPQEDDDAGTPAQESEAPEEDEASSPPVIQSIPRKRRGPGRPPRISRGVDFDTPDPAGDDGSEGGTPVKRRRGRPSGGGWRGGFRGRPKGGPSHATRVPIDKEGNMMDVVEDEVALPEDPEGETKVDKNGYLQGGRDYRVRVFTILGRGERLYMLSTEPARCTGFRDSYLFFTKHMQLYKIIIDENEKKDLIARDLIPHSYKGRAIGVVTARSVFREFGARIIIGGRKVIDDYYVTAAKERGDVEGEIADPNDRLPPPGEPYNKNQYVAWHGASQVYHTNLPSVPLPSKPATGKRRGNITVGNWQFEHAREARFATILPLHNINVANISCVSRFNSTLTSQRRSNLDGVYDAHTNLMFYPKIMQPTHAKWEPVSPPASPRLTNGDLPNGNHSSRPQSSSDSTFKPVPPVVSTNFLVADTHFVSAPSSNLGIPGPDGDVEDLGPNGLGGISAEVLEELPADCRQAFEEAMQRERQWKSQWGNEASDGWRGQLRIGFNGFPV